MDYQRVLRENMSHCWEHGPWLCNVCGKPSISNDERELQVCMEHRREDGYPDDSSTLCLLEHGHSGQHVWTPTNQIFIQLKDSQDKAQEDAGLDASIKLANEAWRLWLYNKLN